jgi:hypothetical protein
MATNDPKKSAKVAIEQTSVADRPILAVGHAKSSRTHALSIRPNPSLSSDPADAMRTNMPSKMTVIAFVTVLWTGAYVFDFYESLNNLPVIIQDASRAVDIGRRMGDTDEERSE